MGIEIERDTFSNEDYVRFSQVLKRELSVLEALLAKPGFGKGPSSVGVELELNLIGRDPRSPHYARPVPVSREVLARTIDPRVTLEVNRFNLEINTTPELLAGAPFTALGNQLSEALSETARAAESQGADLAVIGILPTLSAADLTSAALTQSPRFRALNQGLKRLRREAFPVRIDGDESLSVTASDVTFEGANTSLQVHLRPPHQDFVATFNASLAATGPALAVACNSPLFLGQRLWHETRVALFRQAVDDRADALQDDWRPARVSFGHGFLRQSALEPFAESVSMHEPLLPALSAEAPTDGGQRAPRLGHLRLHQGTVWRWNRAIYDHTDAGHVRMELRALPAGPSVTDMMASAAFLVGLSLGLAPGMEKLLRGLTFGHARRNFYQAARYGLGAELVWPDPQHGTPRTWTAVQLFEHLLPLADRGLSAAGVSSTERARLLCVVERRVAHGVSGASWQRRVYDKLLGQHDRERALRLLLERYQEGWRSGMTVDAWPDP